MAFEMKENSGSLFKNDRREKETHPHAKGSALIDGKDYWVSAWTKEDRNGNKYQSLSFQLKDRDAAHKQNLGQQRDRYADDDLNDSLPPF